MKKKKYLNSGTVRMRGDTGRGHGGATTVPCSAPCPWQVTLLSFAVESDHTFLDYIRGG